MRLQTKEGGLTTFSKEMDRFLDRFWDGDDIAPIGVWAPDVDVVETTEALTLKAELPGIEPKDLHLTLDGDLLALRGDKRQEMTQKDERLYRSERHYGSFARTLRLPANVDTSKVTAEFKNGVLTVVLPKNAEARGKAIPIKIG
jgi:HSP20 family protein